MINEVVEIKEYLEGKNIDKRNLYRICFLLAKWFKEQGLNHNDIRQSIFSWANENHIYIKYKLNSIIYKALDDKSRLRDNIIVKINNNDIKEIKSRFDSKNTRLVALAVLCYAKAYADRDKLFNMSSVALSCWLKIDKGNLSGRYLKELIDFGFISKVSSPNNTYKWNGTETTSKYKLEIDMHNNGNYILIDNSIMDLFSEIFV